MSRQINSKCLPIAHTHVEECIYRLRLRGKIHDTFSCLPYIGENANSDFLTFLEIVICDFTQTFTTSREVVSKLCKWKIIVIRNFSRFFLFSRKTVWNFGDLSPPVYRDRGYTVYTVAAKSWRFSLKLFHQRAPNFFIGSL